MDFTVRDGRLDAYACAVGRAGVGHKTREGDGVTPIGIWPIRYVLYRPDRVAKPDTALSVRALTPEDGWCDAVDDPQYNRLVRQPFAASHETLWRDDHLYDVIAALGFNDDPVIAGKGSAIFLHVAKPGYAPTEGCVALALPDLLAVLKNATPDSVVRVMR